MNVHTLTREGRLGIDLVHDDVERELHKEAETIEEALSLLRRALEQANEQIRLLRSTKYFLDQDNKGKANALKIDKHCTNLQETSLNLSIYHGVAPLDPG
jgi:tektin-1